MNDPREMNNLYDNPSYAHVRDKLKAQFAQLRIDVGDDGSLYPECEKVVQEFWDYDDQDRQKAIKISAQFRQRREAELNNAKK